MAKLDEFFAKKTLFIYRKRSGQQMFCRCSIILPHEYSTLKKLVPFERPRPVLLIIAPIASNPDGQNVS